MSVWSLKWHFKNKSVTGAPYSITVRPTVIYKSLFTEENGSTQKTKQNENSENSDQVDHITWHLELYNHYSSPNLIISQAYILLVPSVLWRRWLGGRKGIRPVKKLSG